MLWEGNILFTLSHREIGNWRIPVSAQHKVLRKLIGLDDMKFKSNCNFYPKEYLYYNNRQLYLECREVCSCSQDECSSICLIKAFKIPKGSAVDEILDIMFPINPNSCICCSKDCWCFKRYCMCITFDQRLLRFDCDTGVLIDEKYVGAHNYRYTFRFCKWSGLEDLYVLKANREPYCERGDERCMMAVFNSKLRFKYVFEVEQRVFGTKYQDANIKDQLFFVYINNNVQIYSFTDLIKEGVFVLEDRFDQALRESRKTLKINFKIRKAPPVLLNVHCFGNPLEFGINPHHCLIRKTRKTFFIKNLEQNTEGCFNIDETNDNETDLINSDKVIFHPILRDMVIVQQKKGVHCYKIIDLPDCVQLEESFVLKFPNSYPSSPCVASEGPTIFAINFELSLGLIGILGYHRKDPDRRGFVKLFDCSSGEEVGSVKTSSSLKKSDKYSLFIDLDIVVVNKESQADLLGDEVEVYALCRSEYGYAAFSRFGVKYDILLPDY